MRTPGLYSDIKVATQRNQLPSQAHKIIFINTDVPKEIPPTDIFDTAEADTKTAKSQSNAGRMMAAALAVSQGIDVEMAVWTCRREDIKCDYKETFTMPFEADGTATANLYYNHKSHLQTASMTIRQDSVGTSYEFLGGSTPDDDQDIIGCSLLAGRVRDGMAEFTIYGFSKDAHFDNGKFDAVEVLLELRPLLTREMVRIDEKFEFVDVIPAEQAGMASSAGDVYPHLTEPLVNSCCELVLVDGAGGGGNGLGSDGSNNAGGDSGGDGDSDGTNSDGGDSGGDGDGVVCGRRYNYILRQGDSSVLVSDSGCEYDNGEGGGIIRKLHNICLRKASHPYNPDNLVTTTHLVTYKDDGDDEVVAAEMSQSTSGAPASESADALLGTARYSDRSGFKDYVVVLQATFEDGKRGRAGSITIRESSPGEVVDTSGLPITKVPY